MGKFKNSLAALLYKTILLAVRLTPPKRDEKHLLIIKTDEIGDYVLFHSYLKYFKQSQKYKDYKITLVGNNAWRQIFEAYDKQTVDNALWLNKKEFKRSISYRFEFLRQIRSLPISDVVNCIFSRSVINDDAIAWVAGGTNKVAMKSDDTNRGKNAESYDSQIYTKIIDAGDQSVFDVLRNKTFVEQVLGYSNLKLETEINVSSFSLNIMESYFALFLGAGNPERKWPIEKFLELANYVNKKYNLVPLLCGGPDDKIDADEFTRQYNNEVLNYTGKTSLLQLIEILSRAKFLICVDTGALHIAAAVKCPVVGLYSGKFYGRFAPYPKEITEHFYPVYPDFVDKLIAEKNPVLYNTFVMKNDTMKQIDAQKVLYYVNKVMSTIDN